MAVCNIFKHLTKETGTFLTFSQYMEDLTAWQTKSKYYKLTPSKFVSIDCQSISHTNVTLPKLLQEKFENACALFKNNQDANWTWTPEYAKTLFWDTMFGTSGNDGLITISDIKYVGDINLQSYNEVDGMGYSEIYCHIPNEAQAHSYNMSTTSLDTTKAKTLNVEAGEYLEGLEEKLSSNYEYTLDKTYQFAWDDASMGINVLSDESSFNINMIVVLYDILNDQNVQYRGIPMGLYITGLVSDQQIQNSITKYVSNEDIYNSGTSYGLRICSRYVVSGENENYIVKTVTCEDNNYGDLSRVLSQISISQNKMDDIINRNYQSNQNYKDLLAIFKNSRTNVPYIKTINNISYWFVNGKMVGPATLIYNETPGTNPNPNPDTNNTQGLFVYATATNNNGAFIFDKTSTKQETIELKWNVFYNGQKVFPQTNSITISKTIENSNSEPETITPQDHSTAIDLNATDTTKYTITVSYEGLSASAAVQVYFVYPTYFGEIFYNETSETPSVTGEEIKKLPSYIELGKNQTKEITTNSKIPGHVCYAYPKAFGELSTIEDSYNYVYYRKDDNQNTNSFNSYQTEIDGITYNIYIDKTPSYVYKQILKFK